MRRLIVEADGGSRGNPGPAGYGALVRDADTHRVLAERAASVGRATNNVAEYGGLVAGLQAALDLDPTAEVEVRMDSKLVVEQMSGRWQVKHPDMKQLALQARDQAAVLGDVVGRPPHGRCALGEHAPAVGVAHQRAVPGRTGIAPRPAVRLDDQPPRTHRPDSAVRTRIRPQFSQRTTSCGSALRTADSSLP